MLDKLNGWKKILATAGAIGATLVGAPPSVTHCLLAYVLGQGVADIGKHSKG